MASRNIFLKFILFILLLLNFQQYISLHFPYKLPYSEVLNAPLASPGSLLYFGDSTIAFSPDSDLDKRSIPTLLQSVLPDLSVYPLYHEAYHLEMYYLYVRYLADKKNLPPFIVIPINLRSFSSTWDLRPEYQFSDIRLRISLANTPVKPFLGFVASLTSSSHSYSRQEIFDHAPVYLPRGLVYAKELESYSFQPYSDSHMEDILHYFYLQPLDFKNRKLVALETLARLFKEQGTHVVFYVIPLDWEIGEKYLGAKFRDLVSLKIKRIEEIISRYGFSLLNLSFALPHSEFAWSEQKYPNEHLNFSGRQFVAAQIAGKL